MATVKCRYCGKEIDRDEAYHNEGQKIYYCSLLHLNSANQKRLKKEQKNFKSIKGTDRRQATDLLQQLYYDKCVDDARIPWDLLGAQMKNMLDEHKDWNYNTIYGTLWYMTKVKEMDLLSDLSSSPLNLVPYYVMEARDYIEETKHINELANAFELSDPVVVKATNRKPKNKFKKITF